MIWNALEKECLWNATWKDHYHLSRRHKYFSFVDRKLEIRLAGGGGTPMPSYGQLPAHFARNITPHNATNSFTMRFAAASVLYFAFWRAGLFLIVEKLSVLVVLYQTLHSNFLCTSAIFLNLCNAYFYGWQALIHSNSNCAPNYNTRSEKCVKTRRVTQLRKKYFFRFCNRVELTDEFLWNSRSTVAKNPWVKF